MGEELNNKTIERVEHESNKYLDIQAVFNRLE